MTRPLRVLIVRVGAMGDVLHGLPAVAALREALPDCFIGWAVEPKWRVLLGMPMVDRVHEVPTGAWKKRPFSRETLGEILALREEMRGEKYDVCLDFQGSIRSAVIGRMSGARRFVGELHPREWPAAKLYDQRVELRPRNVIDRACELVWAACGLEKPLLPGRVTVPVTAKWESGEGFVFVVPGAGWGAKEWGVERYRELVLRLAERGFSVVVNGQGSTESARRIAGARGTIADVGLGELVELTRRAAVVIGGDTGPVHLGAALGRPTVAIFGPTDPERNGPAFAGARVTVIRNAASRNDYKRHAETEAGLARVTVDEVLAAALAIMGVGTGSKPVPGE